MRPIQNMTATMEEHTHRDAHTYPWKSFFPLPALQSSQPRSPCAQATKPSGGADAESVRLWRGLKGSGFVCCDAFFPCLSNSWRVACCRLLQLHVTNILRTGCSGIFNLFNSLYSHSIIFLKSSSCISLRVEACLPSQAAARCEWCAMIPRLLDVW